jgi:hypothetical protein
VNKYGRDLSAHIPEDEPFFVIRARDALAPAAVGAYAALVRAAARGVVDGAGIAGSDTYAADVPMTALADAADNVAAAMVAWQAGNPGEVDLPD